MAAFGVHPLDVQLFNPSLIVTLYRKASLRNLKKKKWQVHFVLKYDLCLAEIYHLSFFFHILRIFFQLYSPLADKQPIFVNPLWLCNDDHLEKIVIDKQTFVCHIKMVIQALPDWNKCRNDK